MAQRLPALPAHGIIDTLPRELMRLVRRAAGLAGTAAYSLRLVAAGAAVAGLALLGMLATAIWPLGRWEAALLALAVVVLLIPPWLLRQSAQALEQLAALPDQFADLAEQARLHGEELQRLLREVHESSRTGTFASITAAARLARAARQTRVFAETLAPLIQLLELQFIGSLAVALPLCAAEIVIASLIVLWRIAV